MVQISVIHNYRKEQKISKVIPKSLNSSAGRKAEYSAMEARG